MTRKDYTIIAEMFYRHKKRYGGRTDTVINEVIDDLCEVLKDDNQNFDTARFKNYCEHGDN